MTWVDQLRRNNDTTAFWRELGRVAGKIRHHLPQPHFVADDEHSVEETGQDVVDGEQGEQRRRLG